MQNKIQIALEYWRDRLSKEYGKEHILNIALYGSQNYNLDTPKSDIDVKAIYIPSLTEAILNKKRLSKELHNEKGEHCELKDIREMCDMYKKQNINFLETLFTEYRWDNPKYNTINSMLKSKAEDIARYNPYYGIKSICGQILNTIKQFKKDTHNYNLKKVSKAIFLYLYLYKYITNKRYKDCLRVDIVNDKFLDYPFAYALIMKLKTKTLYDFNDNELLILKNSIDFLEKYLIELMTNIKQDDYYINDTVEQFLNIICFKAILKLQDLKKVV